jgi:hypothetical protein
MVDESADCGCRRIKPDVGAMTRVIWCPEHPGECPGPWRPTTIEEKDYPDDDIDDLPEDLWMRDEEDEWERAMDECGKVPAAQGGCLMAGTEFCDFECPFRDDEDDES